MILYKDSHKKQKILDKRPEKLYHRGLAGNNSHLNNKRIGKELQPKG
jgi:hypothetical protein